MMNVQRYRIGNKYQWWNRGGGFSKQILLKLVNPYGQRETFQNIMDKDNGATTISVYPGKTGGHLKKSWKDKIPGRSGGILK
jgi:hypothetical protein